MAEDSLALRSFLHNARSRLQNCSKEELVELLLEMAALIPPHRRPEFLQSLEQNHSGTPLPLATKSAAERMLGGKGMDDLLREVKEEVVFLEKNTCWDDEEDWNYDRRYGPHGYFD
jgi:hypothetical protein